MTRYGEFNRGFQMAKRTRVLHPDQQYQAPDGQIFGIVSREQIQSALMDFEAVADIAGGGFSVVYWRKATGLPNEMVTTNVMIEWKDRTDARPQPETERDMLDGLADGLGPQAAQEYQDPEFHPQAGDVVETHDPEGYKAQVDLERVVEEDGLVRDDLPDEDTSSIPAHAL